MSRLLYVDSQFGISGDMMVGALLDLGADEQLLRNALKSLPIAGYSIEISKVNKSGITATDFNVVLDDEHDNHDHDMEYLYGHYHLNNTEDDNIHKRICEAETQHTHAHEMGQQHDNAQHQHNDAHAGECVHIEHDHIHNNEHHHHHAHCQLRDVLAIIHGGCLSPNAATMAENIFVVLAGAEAAAHGKPVEEVNFHEVGAIDSIVDVTAVAVALDSLDIDGVVVTGITDGKGSIRCQHGIMPVPVPAVANIVKQQNLKLNIINVQGELTTPTGAAISAAVATAETLPQDFSVLKIGYGAGKRQYTVPSLLRLMLIETSAEVIADSDDVFNGDLSSASINDGHGFAHQAGRNDAKIVNASCNSKADILNQEDEIIKLETNIDDSTGENLGFVMERLLLAGAKDVYYTPIFMKKNRPAQLLSVICKTHDVNKLENIIFKNTTTIGIRRTMYKRSILAREQITIATPFGEAMVKKCQMDGDYRYYPEYESVKQLCNNSGKSYQEIYSLIQQLSVGK